MLDYDAALKLLLKGPAKVIFQMLGDFVVTRWLDVVFKTVRERRIDLLGETDDGRLLHIELQSENEEEMPWRMMDYGARVARQFRRYPVQIVLYVGRGPLWMEGDYCPNGEPVFHYKVEDIRNLDGKRLLDSDKIGDNVLAILARLGDEREAVRRIVNRIGKLRGFERESRLDQLWILAGLRRLGQLVEEEKKQMPVTESLANHDSFGPIFRKGLEEGLQEGCRKGELTVLRRLIARRFGPIPAWLEERLARCSVTELEELSDRVLDAQSLEDLLK